MILNRIFQASTLKAPSEELVEALTGGPTASGKRVTPDKSLQIRIGLFLCANTV